MIPFFDHDQAGNKSRFLANLGQADHGCCLAGLGASPGWFSKTLKPWAIALRLDGLGASLGWF